MAPKKFVYTYFFLNPKRSPGTFLQVPSLFFRRAEESFKSKVCTRFVRCARRERAPDSSLGGGGGAGVSWARRGDMASLQEVIPQFLNPDNNARQAAEQIFAQHKANPPVFATQLLELARTLPEPQMRQMCAVLLRRNLDTTFWPAVGAQGQQAVKAGLLEGVVAETHPNIRKALADTISKLAGIAASTGGAPQ